MYDLPLLTDDEWCAISQMIPRNRAGPAPRFDREIVSALAYAAATRRSVESLPPGYPSAASIRTRACRWQAAGVYDAIMAAAEPAVVRMEIAYRRKLIELSMKPRSRSPDDPELAHLPRLKRWRLRR
jgi:transposase